MMILSDDITFCIQSLQIRNLFRAIIQFGSGYCFSIHYHINVVSVWRKKRGTGWPIFVALLVFLTIATPLWAIEVDSPTMTSNSRELLTMCDNKSTNSRVPRFDASNTNYYISNCQPFANYRWAIVDYCGLTVDNDEQWVSKCWSLSTLANSLLLYAGNFVSLSGHTSIFVPW